MGTSQQEWRQGHYVTRLQQLLDLKKAASPFSLLTDTLEQSSKPLEREFISRAKRSGSKVIFVSFATVRVPTSVDTFIKARGKTLDALKKEIWAAYPPAASAAEAASQKTLIIIDTLNILSSTHPNLLSPFLSVLIRPGASLLATYHLDIPLTTIPTMNEYHPSSLKLLTHLATAVLHVKSLPLSLERHRATLRSKEESLWGMAEGREGVLIGLPPQEWRKQAGIVIEADLRRRSGRSLMEKYVVTPGADNGKGVCLFKDHSLVKGLEQDIMGGWQVEGPGAKDGDAEGEMETTFSLGLTEKQKRDRDAVVLPYFDAQTDVGGGEGGRILYEMGREDDFDDEEDEI